MKRKPLNFYLSKIVRIINPTCPQYDPEDCISYDSDNGKDPCTDARGWISDGTRCTCFKKKTLRTKIGDKFESGLGHIFGVD